MNSFVFLFFFLYLIGIAAQSNNPNEGDISIDNNVCSPNVTYSTGELTTTSSEPITSTTYPPTIYDCDFECNCTCNWKHDDTINFKWIVTKGSTLTTNTGPDGDHTTGSRSGFFIYIETSSPAKFNDTVRLISPDLIVTNDEQCFRFYYHMFGSDIYRLNVYARINGNLGKALWQKEGNQRTLGDISIDNNVCSPNVTYSTGELTTTSSEPITSTTYLPTIYDCDFECNCTCNWKHDDTTNFKWIVTKGSTLTTNTGPDGDHTTGSRCGFYIYIETSSPAKLNDTTRLISPNLITTNDEQCFRFYYHMFGSDIYRLNVYARINGNLGKALWQKEGNQ
ncbi:unnamed protein product, partial [Rotaria sordida]